MNQYDFDETLQPHCVRLIWLGENFLNYGKFVYILLESSSYVWQARRSGCKKKHTVSLSRTRCSHDKVIGVDHSLYGSMLTERITSTESKL